ncbi:hypothetical protein [Bacteroides rodentium]
MKGQGRIKTEIGRVSRYADTGTEAPSPDGGQASGPGRQGGGIYPDEARRILSVL